MAYTTIDYSQQYFQCVLYTGDGSSRTITLPDTDADTDPDVVWIKQRGGDGTSHTVFDSVRGAQEAIFTNNSNAETTRTDAVSAFNTDGFDLGSNGDLNANTETYAAWCWKESATAGFDIVAYTGDGVIGTTVAHSLSAKPEFILIKARAGTNAANNWYCWNVGLSADRNLSINTNAAQFADPGSGIIKTTQNTSNFGFSSSDGSGIVNVNEDSTTFIAYLWSAKQGFSKFGKYTGNGNADGPFIYLGFRPAWILTKRTDSTGNWNLFDNRRTGGTQELTLGKANPMEMLLHPDLSNAEVDVSGGGHSIDGLANGFKIRSSSAISNASDGTYVYACFADAPLVNSKGVPCCAM